MPAGIGLVEAIFTLPENKSKIHKDRNFVTIQVLNLKDQKLFTYFSAKYSDERDTS